METKRKSVSQVLKPHSKVLKPTSKVFFRATMGLGVLPGRHTLHGSVIVENKTTEYSIKKKAMELILSDPLFIGKDPEVTIIEIKEMGHEDISDKCKEMVPESLYSEVVQGKGFCPDCKDPIGEKLRKLHSRHQAEIAGMVSRYIRGEEEIADIVARLQGEGL